MIPAVPKIQDSFLGPSERGLVLFVCLFFIWSQPAQLAMVKFYRGRYPI